MPTTTSSASSSNENIKPPRNYVGELFKKSQQLGGTRRNFEVTYNTDALNVIRAFLQRTSCVSPDDQTVYKVEIVPTVAPKKDAQKGWHFRKRKFWSRNDAPRWFSRLPFFVGGDNDNGRSGEGATTNKPLEGLEMCEWREEEKRLYTYTRNISLRKMIVCEELAVIKPSPEDANKCVKVCEVRFRVAFRGPWLLGLHKIAERWVAKRYERLVKETSQMEVNRIESLKKMEEYVKEMLAGTKCAPSLEKIEKFVSACERTNYSAASSLDSSAMNLSLSPDRTFSQHAQRNSRNSATKKKEEEEEEEYKEEITTGEEEEEENRQRKQPSPYSETPRSSDGTERMEPDFFGNEDEEEDDLEYQPGTASSLRSDSVSEEVEEEEEEEEQKERETRATGKGERGGKENHLMPMSSLSSSKKKNYDDNMNNNNNNNNNTPENSKQPLRLLFQNQTFKIEVADGK
jgi:hypothetical protein